MDVGNLWFEVVDMVIYGTWIWGVPQSSDLPALPYKNI